MKSLLVFVINGFSCYLALPALQDNAESQMVSPSTLDVRQSDCTTIDPTHDHDMFTHNHLEMSTNDHGSDTGSSHSMQMSFYASPHATILFDGWHTMTYAQLFGSALAIALMALLYEGFKVWRMSLWSTSCDKCSQHVPDKTEDKTTADMAGSTSMIVLETDTAHNHESFLSKSMSEALKDKKHIIQALLHTLQLFLGYCLMLIFMTYNIYLCLALVIGSGIGYWLFCWKKGTTEKDSHCDLK